MAHSPPPPPTGSSAPASPAPEVVPQPPQRPITRSQRGIHKPKVYTDGTIRYGQLATTPDESPTLQHALFDKKWRHAMDVEYEALIRNKTWHLVPPQRGKM